MFLLHTFLIYNSAKILLFHSYLVLKWIVQRHKNVCNNSRLRLEYAYLLFNEFIINSINSELIKIGRILTSFSVTETSCDDTSRASRKKSAKQFLKNTRTNFVIILNTNYGFGIPKVTLKCNNLSILQSRLEDVTWIFQMVLKTKPKTNSKYTKMLMENFLI